jgi:hypothetical protein
LATISTLAPFVQNRLEENPTGPPGIFWSYSNEIFSALVEGICDLLLLIGRPTQTVQQPFTIQPNNWFQVLPSNVFLITDLLAPGLRVKKIGLFDLDFTQSFNGSDWQQDIGPTIQQWGPLGLNSFFVHPAVSQPQDVTITGIANPVISGWPFSASTPLPFEDNIWVAIEEYAAHYCAFKEGGAEFQNSMTLYQSFLDLARRYSAIQDRRDPYVFTSSLGGRVGVSETTAR